MNETINDSSRLVAQALQAIKDYVEMYDIRNSALLNKAEDNLEKTLEILAKIIG